MGPKKPKLKLIPLGGLGEVGKNMLVVEYQNDIVVIDAGLMFPEEEMLGIDLVLPNFSYLKKNQEKLRGIIITHGHEDHTGALPYLLREIKKVPVFGTKLTLGLIKGKLREHGIKKVALKEVKPESRIALGCFKLEFMRVCHSIPDGLGLAIHTPVGIIVHSGDFKIDRLPLDGQATDFGHFALLKEKGVLALLSDSTNAEVKGHTLPERTVGGNLAKIFTQAKGRIVVASFSSHIHRIQQILDIADKSDRSIAIIGKNMRENVAIAAELGYLRLPEDKLIDPYRIKKYLPKKLVILCTGSQGEPLSALTRIASGDHKQVRIQKDDTVIISARPVPGNESAVYRTINRLYRCGAEVHYESVSGVHVSGHASQEELKLMIKLVAPKYFIPIHGEYRHLINHARLAVEVGIPKERIIIAENGDVIEFNSKVQIGGKVEAGIVLVDGLGVGDISSVVLRDRQLLSQDGVIIVVVTIDMQSGKVIAGPDIISRGFVYVKESQTLLEEARQKVISCLEETAKGKITEWSVLKNDVRNTLSEFIYDKLKRRPIILPIVMEV